ncbi:hypothetical protein RF11_08265 [Thelohanellus kitauei]|uniref:Uncharacterized protein n=1 Tax=Thelohanellus kitauei TaxID=669202 RepID=A0A0C2ILI1_THEKT|nr:hypothetical protein RF11_08265 [Thelohanellus kitauei]
MEEGAENGRLQENERVIYDYIRDAQIPDIFVHMNAVRNFISHFSNEHDTEVHHIFTQKFPLPLLEEFCRMSASGTNTSRYRETKGLFFDVFTFIFRDINQVNNDKASLFISSLVRFIKTRESDRWFDPSALMNSIITCVSHEPNKVLFINGNVMYNFYYYFRVSRTNLLEKYFEMCECVHEINMEYRSSLCCTSLSDNIHKIMKKIINPFRENRGKLCLIMFKMVYRLRLFDSVKFNVSDFFDYTVALIKHNYQVGLDLKCIVSLSKIWTAILNRVKVKIRITSVENLVYLSYIFCIDLSRKLMEVYYGSGQIHFTKNKKMKLYIIHMFLVGYPFFNLGTIKFICVAIRQLNLLFGKFLEKFSLTDLAIEDEFFIVRFYIKSLVTVRAENSYHEEKIFEDVLERLATYPFYKLHLSYIDSIILFDISHDSIYGESYFPCLLYRTKTFLHDLILALSDKEHIDRIQGQQKLFLYGDQEIDIHSIIHISLSRKLISSPYEDMRLMFMSKSPIIVESAQYKMYYQLMKRIVLSFNESKYLDKKTADDYLNLCDNYTDNLSNIKCNRDHEADTLFSTLISNMSQYEKIPKRHTFQTLLGYFVLIYEKTFIFGDYAQFKHMKFD